MATNQEAIDRALYELGFHEYGASADATDSADALAALNAMMHEWTNRSMDFNWFTQDTLGDTLPIPVWAESGVISNLALKLGAVFNIEPTRSCVLKAKTGRRTIGNTLITQGLDNADMTHLPMGEGREARYSIETDS